VLGDILGEVLLVDNAGDLHTEKLAVLPTVSFDLISPGTNLGYATGANLAVERAQWNTILFLSPDAVMVALDWRQLGSELEARHVGAIGALTLNPATEQPSVSWGEFPGLRRMVRRFTGARRRCDRRRLHALGKGVRVDVEWMLGAALLVRRDVFFAAGRFNEHYVTAGEDQDFGQRLRALGCVSRISPAWKVAHRPRNPRSMAREILENDRLWLREHGNLLDRVAFSLLFPAENRRA
jgi:GT2 family glycosyltransferase